VTERHNPRAAEGKVAPEDREEPVVRDKRRIDPSTGAVRPEAVKSAPENRQGEPAGAPGARPAAPRGGRPGDVKPEAKAADDRVAALEKQVAERTADLQRLQADYINYRRRVERDREAVRETAVVNVLANLLPVLDDIGRARDHGELEGGFRSVGEALEATVEKLGLQRYGTAGEPFDPTVHEALMHSYSAAVTEPTAVQVLQPGYRFGDRVVRPARVAVAEPETAPATAEADDAAPSAPGEAREASDASDTSDASGDDDSSAATNE
jgi:molecular chaperone GrpE